MCPSCAGLISFVWFGLVLIIQDLDLSYNQLSQLVPEAFANLISLVSLRLRGNELLGLPADLFGPLARLSVLDLSFNLIETVPATVLRHLETRISTLRLEGMFDVQSTISKLFSHLSVLYLYFISLYPVPCIIRI